FQRGYRTFYSDIHTELPCSFTDASCANRAGKDATKFPEAGGRSQRWGTLPASFDWVGVFQYP
ncbi:hypothetical protein, partial [Desulfomarina sp.]